MPGPIVSYHPLLQGDLNLLLVSQRELGPQDRAAIGQAQAVLLPQAPRPDLYALVQELGKPHFPRAQVQLSLDGKVGNFQLFSRLGLPQPATMAFSGLEQAVAAWRQGRAPGGGAGPLVAKGAGGGEGRNVFLVQDPEQLLALGGRLETSCARGPGGLVLQELIQTGGRDARVVMVGGFEDAFWRVGQQGEFRSNLSQGGRVERGAWPGELEAARALARRLGRAAGLDVAAVDLLVPPGGQAMLLEINFYFGRQALGGSQAFWDIYLEAVRGWLAGQGMDPARVRLAQEAGPAKEEEPGL